MSLQICKLLFVVTIAIAPLHAVTQEERLGTTPDLQTNDTISRARSALQRHDFDMALKAYQEALARTPQDHTALIGLARVYYYSHHAESALKIYDQLLQQDARDWETNLGVAQVYDYLGEYRLAEQHLRSVLAVQPSNGDAIWALSRTYLYQNRLKEAHGLLERNINQHRGDYRFWESWGEVKFREGYYQEARQDLEHALELNPSATRSSGLLKELAGVSKEAYSFRVLEFRDYAYLLHDGLGNTVFSSPQQVLLGYGNRWRSRFCGEYRRLSRDRGTAPVANIVLLTDSNELRITHAISVEGGGGIAHFVSANLNRPVYRGGVTLQPVSNLRLSAHYGQEVLAPTLTAAKLTLTQKGWSTSLNYKWHDNVLNLDYYQERLADSNSKAGGVAEVRRRVWHGPFDFSLGYKIDSFSFARIDLFHGYFSPKRFVAQSGIIEISGHKGRLHFDYDLALGSESYTRPIVASSAPSVFSQTHNSNFRVLLQVRNSLDLNKNLALQFSFLSFHTALSDGSGSFNANAILFGLRRRF